MLSEQKVGHQMDAATKDAISKLIRELYLKETNLYRQRVKTQRAMEKQKVRMVKEIHEAFASALQSYDHQCHSYGAGVRELRKHLEIVLNSELEF